MDLCSEVEPCDPKHHLYHRVSGAPLLCTATSLLQNGHCRFPTKQQFSVAEHILKANAVKVVALFSATVHRQIST